MSRGLGDVYKRQALLVLQGVTTRDDFREAAAHKFWLMVHDEIQLKGLLTHEGPPLGVWLKVDTGMHRLGVAPSAVADTWARLAASPAVSQPPVLCTHLACADDLESPVTEQQLELFSDCARGCALPLSIANSAGILHWPLTHADWNRPGIMLYGSEPTGAYVGVSELDAVMTVTSEIMAIREIGPGEGVGYGHRWKADTPSRIGTVSLGYGDGYPRHAPSGTPVLVNGNRLPLVGTVSMDMITVDLTGHDGVRVGDPVEAWGKNLPVNEVAWHAGTIGYELLAGMTARLPRVYHQSR